MKSSIKTLQDISSFRDTRTYTGSVRKSAKPDLPTTAILDLYMRRNEKERIEKELKMLKKRRQQLQTKLEEVDKEMSKHLAKATKTAEELRGVSAKEESIGNPVSNPRKRGKTVLEY